MDAFQKLDLVIRAVQAAGTLLISAAAIVFAYLKWRDDREKLKNELWHQRFDIYKQAIHAIADAKIQGFRNWNVTAEFKSALHQSRFAFPSDEPQKLMEEIWHVAWHAPHTESRLSRPQSETERESVAAKLTELDDRLDSLDPDAVFGPYLKRSL